LGPSHRKKNLEPRKTVPKGYTSGLPDAVLRRSIRQAVEAIDPSNWSSFDTE
jgi:hypothetical protein